jgi:hypothetical protein
VRRHVRRPRGCATCCIRRCRSGSTPSTLPTTTRPSASRGRRPRRVRVPPQPAVRRADELFAEKHRARLDAYPLFTGDLTDDLAGFLRQRLGRGRGRGAQPRPASAGPAVAEAADHTAAMIEGQEVFTLLDEQLVVFESVLAAARKAVHRAGKTGHPRARRTRDRQVGGGAAPRRPAREGRVRRAARDGQPLVHRQRAQARRSARREPVQVLQQLRAGRDDASTCW